MSKDSKKETMSSNSGEATHAISHATKGGVLPKPLPSADTAPVRGTTRTNYRVRLLEAVAGKWRMLPVLVVLVVIWAFFASQSPTFLSSRNLSNLALQIVVTSTLSLGLVLLLIIREIDLAVAASSAVSGAVAAKLSVTLGLNLPLALAAGIGCGVGIGLVQGWVVTAFRTPAFIVTLGTSLALQGILLQLLPQDNLISLVDQPMASVANTYLPGALSFALLAVVVVVVGLLRWQSHLHARREALKSSLGRDVVLPTVLLGAAGIVVVLVLNSYRGVPTALAILLGLLAVFYFVTTQTAFGTYLYGLGGNPEAVRRAGISVNRIKLITFMLAGGLAAVGGIIAASRVLGVSPDSADPTIMLEAIGAAVIGGASLFGGRGSVWAALLGALVIGSISNGLFLIQASTPVRLEIEGAILVLAVTADALIAWKSRR